MIIREGLRGGMVEGFNMVARSTEDTQVFYWDICPLYPFISMTNLFPCGPGLHLKGFSMTARLMIDYEKGMFVYKDDDGSFKQCDGVVQAEIGIDPSLTQLSEFPFLPIRVKAKSGQQSKTYRASCRKCLQLKSKKLCQHSMEDRKWTDVYNLRELCYAVCELKYTLFAINEGLIYTSMQPLFRDFMRMLASRKIRHSKVPPSYRADLEKYCADLNQTMGFEDPADLLSPEILEENSYKTAFEKSIMNIIVGKMAQSQTQNSVEFVDNEERVTQIFTDNSLEVKSCFVVNENCLQVTYKKKDAYVRGNRKAQSVVNSAITALSRIHLDKSLRTLLSNGATLIYSDTDSTVFSVKRGAKVDLVYHPSQFGAFSSEVNEDEEIALFVCIGAKNYSYQVRNVNTGEIVRTVTKIRGLSLTGEGQKQMDTNKMLQFVQMLQLGKKVGQRVPQMRIQIDNVTKRLCAKEVQSLYTNFSNEKRYYNPKAHPTKLWAYGTTSYGTE